MDAPWSPPSSSRFLAFSPFSSAFSAEFRPLSPLFCRCVSHVMPVNSFYFCGLRRLFRTTDGVYPLRAPFSTANWRPPTPESLLSKQSDTSLIPPLPSTRGSAACERGGKGLPMADPREAVFAHKLAVGPCTLRGSAPPRRRRELRGLSPGAIICALLVHRRSRRPENGSSCAIANSALRARRRWRTGCE